MLEAELASMRKANTSTDASSSERLAAGGCSKLDSLQDIAVRTVKMAVALSSRDVLYDILIGRHEGWGEDLFDDILGTMQLCSSSASNNCKIFSMRPSSIREDMGLQMRWRAPAGHCRCVYSARACAQVPGNCGRGRHAGGCGQQHDSCLPGGVPPVAHAKGVHCAITAGPRCIQNALCIAEGI